MVTPSLRRASIGLVACALGLTACLRADGQDRLFIPAGGSQTFLNSTTGYTWNFGVTSATSSLVISQVVLPIGKSNGLGDILYRIYSNLGGAAGSGTVVWTGTLTNANVPTNPSSASATVSIAGGLSLSPGAYSLTATATTSPNYVIRTEKLAVQSGGTNISTTFWIQDDNGLGTSGTTLVTTQTVLAQPATSVSTVNFGNFRINASGTTGNAVLTNTAIATTGTGAGTTQTQFLSSTGAVSGAASLSGFTFSGSSSALGAQASGTFSVGLSGSATQTSGIKTGTVTLTNQSIPGSSVTTGTTNLSNLTISVTGTAWEPASASLGNVSLGWFHVGTTSTMATLSGTAQLANTAPANGFSEGLVVTGSALSGGATASSLPGSVIAAGTSAQAVVGLATIATAGPNSGTVTLNVASSGVGTSGLPNLSLANQTAIVTGTGYTGQSTWNTNGSGQWGTLSSNFGTSWNTAAFDGSPGLDANFADTDTATFGGVVTGGTATVTIAGATPSVKSVTFANAAASYVVAGSGLTLLNLGTSAAGLLVSSGSHSISAPVALGSNLAMDVAANSRLGLDGVLSGARNLTKTGGGTAVLAALNTYSGTTSVEGGRLLIDGSQLAATGPIFVASGATLGGRGAAGGAVTVLTGGTLSPGASIESLAVGATTFSSTSTFVYEIDSAVPLSVAADLLTSNGNLSIAAGTFLQLSDIASSPTAVTLGTKFTLVSYGANTWDGGVFSYAAGPLANGSRFIVGLNEWEITYDDTTGGVNFPGDQLTGSFVTIQAVPEPNTIVLAGLGIGLAAFAARRRTRKS